MTKKQQKELLNEIMEADAIDGLYSSISKMKTTQTDDNKMKSTQTAVEWIFQKMTEQGTNPYWDMRFIQAKQMEKEQIIDAWIATDNELQRIAAEQYYNETYNK